MKTILYFQSSLCASNNAELNGAFRFAKSSGWRIQVVPYGEAAGDRQHLGGVEAKPDIRDLMSFWRADGAIVDSGAAPGVITPSDFGRHPVVFVDYPPTDGVLTIVSDSQSIAEAAARELLRVPCAAYAFVPWREPLAWSVDRGRMFEMIVRMNGREVIDSFDGDVAVDENQLRSWLLAAPRPLGIFAANDYVASQVISCARLANVRIPDDVVIIGVDNDLQICEHQSPALASIQLDHERAGYIAAELLAQRLTSFRRKIASRTFGPIAVIHRETLCKFKRHDDRIEMAVDMIRKCACQGVTVGAIASAVGCSRRLLELRFREVLGRSVQEEILTVRIENAKCLLQEGVLGIAEIAARCGYGSTEALRRIFILTEGVSPIQWRKGRRKGC